MNKNIVVFTTKYIIEDKSLITTVVHDIEGDWQFFGNENDTSNESARIISLGEILGIDPSIEEVLWIPEGSRALRTQKDQQWTTNVD